MFCTIFQYFIAARLACIGKKVFSKIYQDTVSKMRENEQCGNDQREHIPIVDIRRHLKRNYKFLYFFTLVLLSPVI